MIVRFIIPPQLSKPPFPRPSPRRTPMSATLPHPEPHVQAAHCRATPCSAQQQGAEVAATGYRRALPHAAWLLLTPPCRVRVAAGFPRCGCSLAPRRSKEIPKTGDHGGIVRQPERDRSLLTATAYSMRWEKVIARFAHRRRHRYQTQALRRRESRAACGSLLLSRERCSRWLPQPAARAAAFCDDAGGNGGLAYERKFPRFHPF